MRAPWTGRASRSADPAERIDALAQAMDLLDGDVPAEVVDEVAAALERADGRWGLDPSTTVAALVGATGSGKSSLFNALAGADLAEVGVLRPTTTQPLAAVRPGHDVAELVDWIGVSRRVLVPGGAGLPEGLVLVDLPDIDSVSGENREVAGRLARRVDLLVWVFDPQKYADHVVHADWVVPLARHAGATVVALAQADLLDGPGRAAVEADLARLLAEDGVPSPRIVPTSVMTGEGIEELREILTSTAERVRRDGLRVQGALDEAVERVAEALGSGRADLPDLDPDGLARAVADAAGRAAGAPRVARAVGGAYRHRALRECGWLPVRWVGRFRADPLVRLHLGRGSASGSVTSVPAETESAGTTAAAELSTGVRRVADRLGRGRPPAWDRRLHRVARTAAEGLAPELDRAISGADLGLSRDPRWWGWMNAAQWLGWAAALAGLMWILGVGAADRFLLVTWTPPAWRGLPVPTWLILGGVAVTLLVVGIGAVGAAIGWRRRARRARTALDDAVEEVVGARLVAPLVEEDRRQHAVLDALSRAARLR
jgi:energy-coupling factor transporter ATP-binding protein EcfA2